MKLKLVNAMYRLFKEHEVGIRTGAIVVTTIYAVYRAAKDSPRIMQRLEELDVEGATNLEKAKEIIPMAAPSALATAASVGLTLSSGKKAADTISSLSSAYTLMKTAKEEYEAHVEKKVGPEKAKEIKESLVREKIEYDTINDCQTILSTGHGNDIFYDVWSGRYFYSDINFVKKTINDLNYQLMNELFISVNEYYSALGLPGIGAGKDTGWNLDYGQIDLIVTAELDDCDKPYTAIAFRNDPCSKFEGRRW